ncbi:MAG: hypothetical protein ACF8R7_07210 [Phycisphaerales bacterium JB039]
MPTVPYGKADAIQFFEDHVAVWLNDPTAIGLTIAQVTDLSGATVAARSALTAASAARQASKGATTTLDGAVDTMRDLGGPMINAIRAFAEGAADPSAVYAAAQIPPPASPSPAPAPDAPTDLGATLGGDGSITLTWKITRPAPGAQVTTRIYRQLDGAGSFAWIGDTVDKKFTDSTLPAGTTSVKYQMQATAGGQNGPFTFPITIQFGSGNNEAQISLAA